jgi:dihydroceramide fatty acyl 2-hydroxylase
VDHASSSQRMFDNRWIDTLSKSHPVVNSTVLYGAGLILVAMAYETVLAAPLTVAGIALLSWLGWTLFEYLAHRYGFHYEPKTRFGQEIHRIMHGHHHDFPNDHERLMMPLGVSLTVLAVILWTATSAFGTSHGLLVAGFIAIFFMNYDLIHFLTHKTSSPLPMGLKRRHMVHHFRDHDVNYGVSTVLWDRVFGTRRG